MIRPTSKSQQRRISVQTEPTTTIKLGERIARRDAKIAQLRRTIERLESELATERATADFMR